jgi:hypothetical protein
VAVASAGEEAVGVPVMAAQVGGAEVEAAQGVGA